MVDLTTEDPEAGQLPPSQNSNSPTTVNEKRVSPPKISLTQKVGDLPPKPSFETNIDYEKDIISITTDGNYNFTSEYADAFETVRNKSSVIPSAIRNSSESTKSDSSLGNPNKPLSDENTVPLKLISILNVTKEKKENSTPPAQRKNNRIIAPTFEPIYDTTLPPTTTKPDSENGQSLEILRDVLLETLNSRPASHSPEGNFHSHSPQSPPANPTPVHRNDVQPTSYAINPVDLNTLKAHQSEGETRIFTKPMSSGLNLKLAGCNIYGRMYGVGRTITELSEPCLECRCTDVGVHCTPLHC